MLELRGLVILFDTYFEFIATNPKAKGQYKDSTPDEHKVYAVIIKLQLAITFP